MSTRSLQLDLLGIDAFFNLRHHLVRFIFRERMTEMLMEGLEVAAVRSCTHIGAAHTVASL